jgi:hypothetical protein
MHARLVVAGEVDVFDLHFRFVSGFTRPTRSMCTVHIGNILVRICLLHASSFFATSAYLLGKKKGRKGDLIVSRRKRELRKVVFTFRSAMMSAHQDTNTRWHIELSHRSNDYFSSRKCEIIDLVNANIYDSPLLFFLSN